MGYIIINTDFATAGMVDNSIILNLLDHLACLVLLVHQVHLVLLNYLTILLHHLEEVPRHLVVLDH